MTEKMDKDRPGPEPERLKIEGDWEDAIRKALHRTQPADGWPNDVKPRDDEVSVN